jgi:hypothetical protein
LDRPRSLRLDATFIDGSGLPKTASGIFSTKTGNDVADLDISGEPTAAARAGWAGI